MVEESSPPGAPREGAVPGCASRTVANGGSSREWDGAREELVDDDAKA